MALRQKKSAHHQRRLAGKEVIAGQGEFTAEDIETLFDDAAAQIAKDAEGFIPLLQSFVDQRGGDMFDPHRMGVIILHELLDRLRLAVILIAEKGGNLLLFFKVDLIGLAGRKVMKFIANPPEVIESPFELGPILISHYPLDHQLLQYPALIFDLRHPQGGVEITQPPFPLLDIRL